ncbi:hypothetical protein CR513_13055, partial [Mucuna pruriens]
MEENLNVTNSPWRMKRGKKFKCVALSTTKIELGFVEDEHLLFCDSQSKIHIGKNSTSHSRSKHVDLRYHWILDALDTKLLELTKVHTDDNGAYTMTKRFQEGS